jgi:hypothetical protein
MKMQKLYHSKKAAFSVIIQGGEFYFSVYR